MATPEPTSTLVAGMASFNGLIPIFGTTGSSGVSETESGLMVIPSYNNWLSRLNSSSYKTTGPTGGWEQEWWTVYNYLQYGGICVVGATGSTGNYYSASGVLTASNTPLHNKNLVNFIPNTSINAKGDNPLYHFNDLANYGLHFDARLLAKFLKKPL